MKKTATTLILFNLFLTVFSQNIVLMDESHNIVSNTTIDINMDTSANSTEEILVTNTSFIPDTIKVTRTLYNLSNDDKTQFCWGGLCYLFTTTTSSLSLIINPGDTVNFAENGFHAIFNSGVTCNTRTVHYKFYNINNFSDSTGLSLRYNCSTGIDESLNSLSVISNAYPNPANSIVTFKYDLNGFSKKGKILFYDMIGILVKEVTLNDKQGVSKISVGDMEAGVYFYSYLVNNEIISTKKIVISHEE